MARSCLSEHDEEMLALVEDYQAFCSDQNLLPRDRYTLFVPPCGQSFADNIEFALYYNPTTASRRKAAYLGIYANKSVRAIGRIAKVVSCAVDADDGTVKSTDEASVPLSKEEQSRIIGATLKARKYGWDLSEGHNFYLCDALVETDFRKTSPGGIWGHRYFDLEEVLERKIPDSVPELAELLRQHTWEEHASGSGN